MQNKHRRETTVRNLDSGEGKKIKENEKNLKQLNEEICSDFAKNSVNNRSYNVTIGGHQAGPDTDNPNINKIEKEETTITIIHIEDGIEEVIGHKVNIKIGIVIGMAGNIESRHLYHAILGIEEIGETSSYNNQLEPDMNGVNTSYVRA